MTNLRQVLQRLRIKEHIRSISSAMSVHRRIIRKMDHIALEKEWLNLDNAMPSDQEIEAAWVGVKQEKKAHILDQYQEKIIEWHKENITTIVMERLLQELFQCSIDVQVIRRYIQKHIPKAIEPVMVRETTPGKDADVDFGDLGVFEDEDGICKKVYLFSLRLRHSRKAYRELITDQTSRTFNKAHIHAFEFFGGVMEYIHPDCTKCAVIRSSIENNGLNRSYQSCAEHYNFIISPCRPYTPQHKGGVEKDMDYVKRNFAAYFRAHQKALGVKTPKFAALKIAFEKWQKEVDDVHIIQGVGRSPSEIFTSEEKNCLKALPKERWESIIWAQCSVRVDWRVMWESSYYSVPYQFIGKQADICATTSTVRIYHNHEEIALHERAVKKGEYKRKSEHAPPHKEAVLQCSREGLLELSQEIGSHTYQYVKKMLSMPGVDKLAPIRNVLELAKEYGKESLEKACKRALLFQMTSYREIKNILRNNLHEMPEVEASQKKNDKIIPFSTTQFKYARDPEEYRTSKQSSWDETWEQLHPVSKYGSSVFVGYLSAQTDNQIDELIQQEKEAQARGEKGPLAGRIPEPTEAWKAWNLQQASKHSR